ncbi:MAG TPA: ABC transporter substrate-binding protein [Xanthobacteraceae bacterium]
MPKATKFVLQRMLLTNAVSVCGLLIALAGAAEADPVKLRLGYGVAAEEQLWLLIAKPDIGTHYGKDYTIDGIRFTGSDKRAQAFVADAIDLASSSANGVIFAAAEGVEGKIIASISRESTRGYSTTFYVTNSSPIKSVADLKGRTIGINGFFTSGHLWLETALKKVGLSESDVTIAPISFSAMGEALQSGKIDVGEFPQPFDALLHRQASVRKLFSAKDAIPTDEELIVLVGKDGFLRAHAAAVRSFLDDLCAATRFYLEKPAQARQILLDSKMVRLPADVFLNMRDYYRDSAMHAEASTLERMQESQFDAGFQKKKADINQLVDMSYLPN